MLTVTQMIWILLIFSASVLVIGAVGAILLRAIRDYAPAAYARLSPPHHVADAGFRKTFWSLCIVASVIAVIKMTTFISFVFVILPYRTVLG